MNERASTIYNGKYTIQSPRGEHRTFSIKTQPDDAKFAPGKRVIALLTGPDNQSSYKSFGFVTDSGITLFNKYNYEGSPFRVYSAMVWSLATLAEKSQFYKMGYRLLLSKRCLRCNRELTTPESILSGLGPICGGRSHRQEPHEWDSVDEEMEAEAAMESRQAPGQ